MLPYYFVLIHTVLILLMFFDIRQNQQRRIAYYCVMVITIFAGLRGYVGTDTYSYHMMFYDYSNNDLLQSFQEIEPLFIILIKFSSLISEDSFIFTLLISIIQGAILIKLINTSKRPALFLAIFIASFYCNFELNMLRAGTAIMLLILASRYINYEQKKIFYLYCIAGVLMHYSVIIGFFILIFLKEKKWWMRLFFTVLICITIWWSADYLLFSGTRGIKMNAYYSTLEKDVSVSIGAGFFALQILYFSLYTCVVSRANFAVQTFLFLLWFILTWATLTVSYIDRITVIISAIFLCLSTEYNVTGWNGWKKNIYITTIIGIVILGLIGTFKVISAISFDQSLDFDHAQSPYIPYKFFWSEPS